MPTASVAQNSVHTPNIPVESAYFVDLASYSTGAYGLDSSAHMQALFNKVEAMYAAMITHGDIAAA